MIPTVTSQSVLCSDSPIFQWSFFIHEIYIRRRKQWCLRLTVAVFLNSKNAKNGLAFSWRLGLCDMTIYISNGRNKKSIVSYYALSFISWCRKIHCLRSYFFIIWMTACDLYTPPRCMKGRQKQVAPSRSTINQDKTRSWFLNEGLHL